MKIDEMTYDNIKSLALRCPISLPKSNGSVGVKTGDWLSYPAKSEEVRRFYKQAKRDLLEREMRGGSYDGDHGRVMIGGKRFVLYRTTPHSLIREDFANWIESNWQKVLTKDGKERQSTKPLRTDEVKPLPVGNFAMQARMRAKDLNEPTELIPEESWNSQFDMAKTLHRFHDEIERDRKRGQCYVVTRLQAVLLAAMAQHRRRNYAEAVDAFITVAACAIKAAEFEAKMHGKDNKGEPK
jgi:hypothetical protein